PIAVTCEAVFHFAMRLAGIDTSRLPRYTRRTVTATSRTRMITAAHTGNRPIAVSVMIVAATSSLSDSGSSQAPVRVADPYRRATPPWSSFTRMRLAPEKVFGVSLCKMPENAGRPSTTTTAPTRFVGVIVTETLAGVVSPVAGECGGPEGGGAVEPRDRRPTPPA